MTKRSKQYFALKQLRQPIIIDGLVTELSLNEAIERIKNSEFKFRLSYLRRNPGAFLKHTILYEAKT